VLLNNTVRRGVICRIREIRDSTITFGLVFQDRLIHQHGSGFHERIRFGYQTTRYLF